MTMAAVGLATARTTSTITAMVMTMVMALMMRRMMLMRMLRAGMMKRTAVTPTIAIVIVMQVTKTTIMVLGVVRLYCVYNNWKFREYYS